MSSKALVTVILGEFHQRLWKQAYAESWRRYAERHGYDIVVIEDHIDPSDRGRTQLAPHWQKCLILEHPRVKDYDWAVWLDADVLINYNTAPCIVSQLSGDGVGGILHSQANRFNARAQVVRDERTFALNRHLGFADPYGLGREPTVAERYILSGVEPRDDMINTGVLVLQPRKHAAMMRHVYDGATRNDILGGEMMRLSAEILRRGLVAPLDPRFNADYASESLEAYPYLFLPKYNEKNVTNYTLHVLAATTIWNNNYFIHCVGGASFGRLYTQWIFKDAAEWVNYLVQFRE